jgi:hypothetical protein
MRGKVCKGVKCNTNMKKRESKRENGSKRVNKRKLEKNKGGKGTLKS